MCAAVGSWRVRTTSKDFWKKRQHHKEFFDRSGKQLEYKELEDWYKVTQGEINKHGGEQMLNKYYEGSHVEALKSVYPEHSWLLWRFGQVPKKFWKGSAN